MDRVNRSWIELAFDRRFAVIRAFVLAGLLVGDFLLLQRPGEQDWGVAAAGLVLCLAAGKWAFGALVAQSVLLVVAHALGASIVSSLKVLAAVTLFELAVRQPGRRLAAGTTALALAVAVNRLDDLPGGLLPVLYKMGAVAGLPLLLGAYVRVTRDAAVHARQHAEQQEARAEQQLLAVRAAERTTIARELHDLVAHHVSSMVLRVGVARHVVAATSSTDPRITEVLDDLHSSAGAALKDLRRLVAVLRAPDSAGPDTGSLVSPGALPAALESVVEHSRQTGLAVTASVDPRVARLDAVRGLAVLRLAQEGLANAAKHGGPGAHAELAVRLADDAVHVTIHDDGAGRTRPPAPGPSGHGLIGMRERVDLLGGRLDAGPAARGWRLTAELPAFAPDLESQL
ncbi:two-component sensor histidine kinase [Streptomyces sp. TRM S81-3]|uniref:histidine kinase n=1 Tax=Streptomyces griseicoloratus TaxID=2752516 RepID=A0A926KZ13_9ACTN|nr:histidine kinase [Streptomyces griseicoloratus]MBD0419353.1 two-component sensor histidine kinase [Streptomyces griseicoloratus]